MVITFGQFEAALQQRTQERREQRRFAECRPFDPYINALTKILIEKDGGDVVDIRRQGHRVWLTTEHVKLQIIQQGDQLFPVELAGTDPADESPFQETQQRDFFDFVQAWIRLLAKTV